MSENTKSVMLVDNEAGTNTELPVMSGTAGPDVIDIRKL